VKQVLPPFSSTQKHLTKMKAEVNVLIYNMGILALASGVESAEMTPISAKCNDHSD
jgi:hypothetical protein